MMLNKHAINPTAKIKANKLNPSGENEIWVTVASASPAVTKDDARDGGFQFRQCRNMRTNER